MDHHVGDTDFAISKQLCHSQMKDTVKATQISYVNSGKHMRCVLNTNTFQLKRKRERKNTIISNGKHVENAIVSIEVICRLKSQIN